MKILKKRKKHVTKKMEKMMKMTNRMTMRLIWKKKVFVLVKTQQTILNKLNLKEKLEEECRKP